MQTKILVLALSALALSPAATLAQEADGATDLWTTDFAAAKATAAEAGKDLLIDFTGSDWCGWCIKLKEEVFDTDAFRTEIGKHFVLVELDFPRAKEQPEALVAQNQKLQGEFGVQGFPTIFTTDASGRPYGQTGYRQGGPEAYLKHLRELIAVREQRDAHWAEAAKADGADRAMHVAAGLEALAPELHGHYLEEIEAVVAGAGEGELATRYAKLRDQLVFAKKKNAVQNDMNRHAQAGDWTAAAKVVKDFIGGNELDDETSTEMHWYLAMCCNRNDDNAGAIAALESAHKTAAEEMKPRIQEMLTRFRAEAKPAGGGDAKKGGDDGKSGG